MRRSEKRYNQSGFSIYQNSSFKKYNFSKFNLMQSDNKMDINRSALKIKDFTNPDFPLTIEYKKLAP